MKPIAWTDEKGYNHSAMVRDDDDLEAVSEGRKVSRDPPHIERIDWDVVKRDLHNQLLARGLLTPSDVEEQQNGVTGAVLAALRPKVLELYD